MRRYRGLFRPLGAFTRAQFSADYTISMFGFNLRQGQPSVTRLFMAGQSHSALGTAKIITGDLHDRKAIWRIDQTAPEGRYSLDNASRIAEMKDRAVAEAREQLPELRRHFFDKPAAAFVPFHML